jgi:hypothetical protein
MQMKTDDYYIEVLRNEERKVRELSEMIEKKNKILFALSEKDRVLSEKDREIAELKRLLKKE